MHKLRFLVKMFFLIRTVPIMKRNVFWQVIFVYSLLDSLNSGLMIALQMQSIYSCIQVSEDFVSPEHIAQSFHLTHELRHQSKDEINYEDKFQVWTFLLLTLYWPVPIKVLKEKWLFLEEEVGKREQWILNYCSIIH